MWAQIISYYKRKYIDKIIYLCEYRDDGYTKNLKKTLKQTLKDSECHLIYFYEQEL